MTGHRLTAALHAGWCADERAAGRSQGVRLDFNRSRHDNSRMTAGERDDPVLGHRVQSERAVQLMELLGLSEEELCQVVDVDPLTLLSGQLQHRAELPILLDLLGEARERAGAAVLRRWVRATGPHGRPIEMLVKRDFAAFEDALSDLAERGFVLRGGGR